MGNLQAALAELKWIDKILPGGGNVEMLTEQISKLSPEELEALVVSIENGEFPIAIQEPNLSDNKISTERNLKIGEEMGVPFFQHLMLTHPKTGQVYKTPRKYLVMDLPMRLQQQLLIKKKSIPDNNRQVDELTGQPTGDSHSASLSSPEMQVLRAQGLDRAIEELAKIRGGDTRAFQECNRQIISTGGASQDAIRQIPSEVKSKVTLSVLLTSAHIENNLLSNRVVNGPAKPTAADAAGPSDDGSDDSFPIAPPKELSLSDAAVDLLA